MSSMGSLNLMNSTIIIHYRYLILNIYNTSNVALSSGAWIDLKTVPTWFTMRLELNDKFRKETYYFESFIGILFFTEFRWLQCQNFWGANSVAPRLWIARQTSLHGHRRPKSDPLFAEAWRRWRQYRWQGIFLAAPVWRINVWLD